MRSAVPGNHSLIRHSGCFRRDGNYQSNKQQVIPVTILLATPYKGVASLLLPPKVRIADINVDDAAEPKEETENNVSFTVVMTR